MPSKNCWCFATISWSWGNNWLTLQVPSTPKAKPHRIIDFLAYDILSTSTCLFTSSMESAANWRKNLFPGLVSLPDHWPSPLSLFCQESYWMSSDFLASHLFVQASLIFKIMKVSAGWQRCVAQGGKYFKVVLFSAKTVANWGVIQCDVQLSTHTVFVRL